MHHSVVKLGLTSQLRGWRADIEERTVVAINVQFCAHTKHR